MRRLTTFEFIKKATVLHGLTYDYSKVAYKTAKEKVVLLCKIHGEFYLTPDHHLRGVGCPKCAGRYKTKEEFIIMAQKVHKDKYNYGAITNVTAKSKLKIRCPKHGDFFQNSWNHLKGNGCPKCFGKHKSTSAFILEAQKMHRGVYSYIDLVYIGCKEKVAITCKLHGVFWQSPTAHLNGQGCPTCGHLATSNSHRVEREEFISRAVFLHGTKYVYAAVEYIDMRSKVRLYCSKHHHYFMQSPDGHLAGKGCPICGIEKNSGVFNYQYKGEGVKSRRRERNTPRNRKWLKEIKKNKNYCDCCGVYFSGMFIAHAHHLDSWVDHPNSRYDINNGIVLCNYCHDDFHSEYGFGYNTKEQYMQYKEVGEIINV